MKRVLVHPATYSSCREGIDRAFALFPQHITGKKVVIKPNVLRASQADEHIVTNPAILSAVIEKVESLSPAEIVVGDNPGLFSYGQNENSFAQTGLMAAAKGYYKNLGDSSVHLPFNPELMPEIGVSKEILEADIFISLPKFKTHGLTVMTGAIKNSYGILPGAQKAKLHKLAGSPERFHEVIVEVFRLRIPDLFIMDAVVGMEGNGPASPELREIGLLLAADNGVALDAVVARMMGLDPHRLRFLQQAKAFGLGDYDARTIEVIGEMRILDNFKVPQLGGEAIVSNPALQQLLDAKAKVTPAANPEICTACGSCVEHCPVSALTMVQDLPVVDPEVCIACFCCQEICPEKAMSLT
jgi:uncharacterized protein (DUF362 family)/NAD-dependent dihydropyrimidine dehydrogenase PreA subunit